MVPAGTKLPAETYEKLRWLAYRKRTTISAIIASYVARGVDQEDMTGFVPPGTPVSGPGAEKGSEE
jgi:hypothetical protein